MNGKGFGIQVLLALGLSVFGAAIVSVGGIWLGSALALLWGIVLMAGCYLAWLYYGRRSHAGLMLVLLCWLLVAIAALTLSLSAILVLLIFSAVIWMVRSSLRYRKPLTVACDAMLSIVSVAVGVWVAFSTHSLFLSFWSFFLIQALVFFIPEANRSDRSSTDVGDRFSMAKCNAEAVLKRI